MRLNKYCIWLMLKHEISLRWINDKYVSKWLSLRIFQYFMREYIYCFSIFSIFHKLIVFWKFLSIRTTWGQKTKLVPLEKADKVLLFSFSFFVFSSLYYISNSSYRQVDGVEYVCNVRLCDCLLGGIGGLQGGSEVCRAEREREGEEESELRCMQIVSVPRLGGQQLILLSRQTIPGPLFENTYWMTLWHCQ